MRVLGLWAPRTVKSVVWWRCFLVGVGLCLVAPVVELAFGAPGGDAVWTVGYGAAATTLLVGAMAYGGRRRAPRRGPGASYHWLQFHVYGGTLFVVLLLLHTGPRLPDGTIGWGLWTMSVWVVATGLAGVLIQKWVPTALSSGLTTEVHYDRIPELVDHLRGKVEDLVAVADESVRSFYQTNLAAALAGPETRLIYFVDITGGIQTRMRHLDHLRQFLGDERPSDPRRAPDPPAHEAGDGRAIHPAKGVAVVALCACAGGGSADRAGRVPRVRGLVLLIALGGEEAGGLLAGCEKRGPGRAIMRPAGAAWGVGAPRSVPRGVRGGAPLGLSGRAIMRAPRARRGALGPREASREGFGA